MRDVSVREAKTRLSKLLREVEAGTEIVIRRRGNAVARIVPVSAIATAPATRVLGSDRGVLEVPDAFDAPLPEAVLDAFGA